MNGQTLLKTQTAWYKSYIRRNSHGRERLNGQTILKAQTAWTEENGQTLPKTGTAMDGREWTGITEDINSLVPILPKTDTAMDGRD